MRAGDWRVYNKLASRKYGRGHRERGVSAYENISRYVISIRGVAGKIWHRRENRFIGGP